MTNDSLRLSIRSTVQTWLEQPASTIAALDRGLGIYVRDIAGADEPTRQLYGRARALGSEVGSGHRTEQDARAELTQLMQ